MSQHTKEPWRQGKYVSQAVCADHLGEDVIVVEPFDLGSEGPVLPVTVQQANARRIVACINACAGLSTEELELLNNDGTTLSSLIERYTATLAALTDAKLQALPADGLVWVCFNAEGLSSLSIKHRITALCEHLTKAKDAGKTNAQFIITASIWPGQMTIQALPDEELARVGLIRDYVAKGLRDEALSALERLVAAAECFGMGNGSDEYATAKAVLAKSRGDE